MKEMVNFTLLTTYMAVPTIAFFLARGTYRGEVDRRVVAFIVFVAVFRAGSEAWLWLSSLLEMVGLR